MTDCLFVYGTLMRASQASVLGADMRDRLEREATWLGPASTTGRLFDRGAYPIMAPARDTGDRVHGEVYLLRQPDAVFAWLDPYEGIEPDASKPGEYVRIVCRVQLSGGAERDAWVYLAGGVVDDTQPRLSSGRWRP